MNEIYILVILLLSNKVVKKVEMKTRKTRLIVGFITTAVFLSLFMLGPAEAFILGLAISDNSPLIGDTIKFIASAEVEEGEIIPVDLFILKLEGEENVECKFFPNGTIFEGCKGMSIKNISSPEFGFGYGYGYGFKKGEFLFEITLDTSFYLIGEYMTKLIAVADSSEFEVSGGKLFINAPIKGACSIRAEKGLLELREQSFTNNKLNLIVPLKQASDGQGFLISQEKKDRFLYKFDVVHIIENNNKTLSLKTSGTYRLGRQVEKIAEAIIKIDKNSHIINITDISFEIENMKINFMKGCG